MAATQLSSNVKADMKRLSANLLWVKPDDVLYVVVGEGGLCSFLSTPQIAPCAKKTPDISVLEKYYKLSEIHEVSRRRRQSVKKSEEEEGNLTPPLIL